MNELSPAVISADPAPSDWLSVEQPEKTNNRLNREKRRMDDEFFECNAVLIVYLFLYPEHSNFRLTQSRYHQDLFFVNSKSAIDHSIIDCITLSDTLRNLDTVRHNCIQVGLCAAIGVSNTVCDARGGQNTIGDGYVMMVDVSQYGCSCSAALTGYEIFLV